MYFLDNDNSIYETITNYVNADEETRLNLLKENI